MRLFLCSVLVLAVPVSVSYANEETTRITVSEKNCERIQKHIARDDVTYKPGVDVHGRPVAPADLQDNRLKLPDTITIDLSLPLQDLYAPGNQPPELLKNADVQVGKIDYHINSGKMLFNGQELSDPAMHAIAEECRKQYKK